jgi:hypothetical protein
MFVAGQTVGTQYHIIRLLGASGMGAVYTLSASTTLATDAQFW